MSTKEIIDQKLLNKIIKLIQKIKYGEVVITIHNKKVIEIEKKEIQKF